MAKKTARDKTTYVDSAFQVPDGVAGIQQEESEKTTWVRPETTPYTSDVGLAGFPAPGSNQLISVEDVTAGTIDGGLSMVGPVVTEVFEPSTTTPSAEDATVIEDPVIPDVPAPYIIEVSDTKYSIGPSGAAVASIVLDVEPVVGASKYEFRLSEIAN